MNDNDSSPDERRASNAYRARGITRHCAAFAIEERHLPAQSVAAAMILTGAELLAVSPCDERHVRLARELRDALNAAIGPTEPTDLPDPSTASGNGTEGRRAN